MFEVSGPLFYTAVRVKDRSTDLSIVFIRVHAIYNKLLITCLFHVSLDGLTPVRNSLVVSDKAFEAHTMPLYLAPACPIQRT